MDTIRRSRGADLVFAYSVYEVAAPGLQAKAPRSPVYRIPAGEVTFDWLGDRLSELSPGQEMAWHSTVEHQGRIFHIPMIDFVDRPSNAVFCEVNRALTAEMDVSCQFIFFDTGRSFHGYLPELIPAQAWLQYLGRLLTLNENGRPPLIDSRWIGHALVRGFTALRWSHNTTRYLQIPRIESVCGEAAVGTTGARYHF